jgi:hypothetical protein
MTDEQLQQLHQQLQHEGLLFHSLSIIGGNLVRPELLPVFYTLPFPI